MSNKNTNCLPNVFAKWIIGQGLTNDELVTSPNVDLQALEDRVLYSAGPLPFDVVQPLDVGEPVYFESIETEFGFVADALEAYDFAGLSTELANESAVAGGINSTDSESVIPDFDSTNELVIVDTAVEGYEQLVNDLLSQRSSERSFEVVYLSSTADGIGQISTILGSRSNLDAIHLVSHGQDGELRLGQTVLNDESLTQFESEISSWGSSLEASADVLIYGCNVAETEVGESFVQRLSELMDADFSASSDITGHESLGGDWDFELQVGTVEANVAFSVFVQQEWDGSLTIEVTADPLDNILDDTSHDGRGSQQAVAMDDAGNYVVVWSSNGSGGIGWSVLAQRYDNSGAAVGTEISVNENQPGDQQWASVAMDADGDFVVTWTDDNQNEVNYRRYDANGDPITGELRVNAPVTTGTASGSTIAMNSSGNFVITWVGEGMGNAKEIYASAFAADGTSILSNFLVNTTTGGDQLSPAVSINETGNFVVSWHDGNGVYAQRFNANGSTNGTEIDVIVNSIVTPTVNEFSSVALQDDLSFAVLYETTVGVNSGPDVRLFDSSGNYLGEADGNETVTNPQGDASIQVGADGTYILVWEGYGNQSGEFDDDGVFARLIDSSGSALAGEFRVNDYTSGSQNNISVAINDQTTYVFVYSGEGATDSQGVYTLLVSSNIKPTGADNTIETTLGESFILDATDFGYADIDLDLLASVEIETLPLVGELFLNGSLVTAGQTIDVLDIDNGKLQYLPAAGLTGAAIDQFTFFVNDGTANSLSSNTISINATLQPSFWFSTANGESNGPSELPSWEPGDVIEFGGPNFELGSSTVADGFESSGELALRFSLDAFGLNVDAFHYVTQDVTIASLGTNPFELYAGDVLFSTKEHGVDFGGLVDVNGSDLLVFRPSVGDYTAGTFSFLLDMESPSLTDPDLPNSNLWSISLIESEVSVGDVTLSAGDLIYSKQGAPVDNNIYVMNITETGEGTSLATAQLLIDGDEIQISEKIFGLDVAERAVTVGGKTYAEGTLFVTLDAADDVGDNSINVDLGDVFALDVEFSSMFVTAAATAEIVFDQSDTNSPVNITGTGVIETGNVFDAFSLVADPISNASPTGANKTINITEDTVYTISTSDLGYLDSDGDTLFAIRINSVPTTGTLLYQGNPVSNGDVLDPSEVDSDELQFVPAKNSNGIGADLFRFQVNDGVEWSSAIYEIDFDIDADNDAPTLADASTSIGEDAGINDLVIDLTATDPDDTVFFYQIVNGNVGGAFAIDSASGEITVNGVLDFETRSSYLLEVSATDGLGEVDSADISIGVGNVIEPAISGRIYEDEIGDGSVVGDTGVAGVTIVLYQDDGDGTPDASDTFVSSTTTDVSGAYQFNDLPDGDYYVVVDSKTITPTAGFNSGFGIGDVWAQQTYGSNLASFGGLNVGTADDTSNITTAKHLNLISVSGGLVADVDFGFSFNVVTNLLGGDNQDEDLGDNRTVQGSLRQFIQNANAISGDNAMRFVPLVGPNETSVGGDWWSIAVSVALPEITDEGTILDGRAFLSDGVTIRNENGNILGFSGTVGVGADGVVGTADDANLSAKDAPELEIYDVAGLGEGLVISASNVEVSNFAIHGFGDTQSDGGNIYVDGTSSSVTNVTIRNNVLGSSADAFAGPVAGAEQSRNITVRQADAGSIQDNLIGFAGLSGIVLSGSIDSTDGADGWQIIGNEIRDNGRTVATRDGINIILGSGNEIISQNLIIGNSGYGVDSWKSSGGHLISENTIAGNGHGGQETGGVRLFGSSNSVEFNVISDNIGPGVHVVGQYDNGFEIIATSAGNLISKNSFSDNTGIAIDLSAANTSSTIFGQGDGLTPNDENIDTGTGNAGLDHPTLSSAHVEADGLHLFGAMDGSFANREIELYIADSGAGDFESGIAYGEGSIYLGTLDQADVLAFDATSGEFELLLAMPIGGWPTELLIGSVTAIAIDTTSHNTSEFGNANEVEIGWRPEITTGQDLFSDENSQLVKRIRATDPDNDELTFSISGGVDQSLFRINDSTGRLRFIDAPDFEAPTDGGSNPLDNTYEVEVTVTDETGRVESQMFLVHVEDVDEAPTAATDAYSILEGGVFTEDVTLNDTDPENSSLDVKIVGSPKFGTAFVNGDGEVVYRHGGGEEAEDRLVYEITDVGGNVSFATVVVTINPVEDATVVVDDRIAVEFEKPTIIHRNTILANDIDPDTLPADMNLSITKYPDHGVLNLVDGKLVFIPNPEFIGNDTIEYQVEAGGAVSNTGVIVIVVGGSSGSPTTVEDTTDTFEEPSLSEEPVEGTGGEGATNNNSSDDSSEKPQVEPVPTTGFSEKFASTIGKENEFDENTLDFNDLKIEFADRTYAYASRGEGFSLANIAEIVVSSTANEHLSEFETTLLAGLFWEDLDSAKRDYIQGQLQMGVHEIAASAASFLTVGYLAWIIRGGVLLTTFMSSVPTWSAFDIQSVIEAGAGRDESIEQMVDQ